MRIALGIEYDGSAYHGWQRQDNAPSVQAVVEAAVGRVADHPVGVVCAGRTDTGVHATGQVVHFDTPARRPLHAWILGCNSHLPDDVCVRWARVVPDDFHARFKAVERAYRYVIHNTPARPALGRGRVTWWIKPLDVERMAAAARALVGRHDFSAFRAAECQAKSPVRTVHELSVRRVGEIIYLDARADGFLHHMVRNIAGVLIEIGAGRRPVEWAAQVLAGRCRAAGGITAPPDGLYLTAVRYPARYGLPAGGYRPVFGSVGGDGRE
ncbi:MAG: tRNA pseudouridine synthase A [Gammaproteobacteria bacterium]|nr:MAG: tRNA pseudouridine synthase A [Gammaproteobacteria bacterium]